jgi:hypothetical protein
MPNNKYVLTGRNQYCLLFFRDKGAKFFKKSSSLWAIFYSKCLKKTLCLKRVIFVKTAQAKDFTRPVSSAFFLAMYFVLILFKQHL